MVAWTPDKVRSRMREAALTLRRMPGLDERDRPAKVKLASLESRYRRTRGEAFAAAVQEVAEHGQQAAPHVTEGPPDPDAIDRMNEALSWLWWLNKPQRSIVFAKAVNPRVTNRLMLRFGVGKRTIHRWHDHALKRIAKRLNGN